MEAMDGGSELAWGRLLSFSYWGLGCLNEFGGVGQVPLSTLVRQQVARFMENTDLPVVQVTPRTRYGVRGGDETLKKRVTAKSEEGDVSVAVRKLASAEGLAPQYGDTLRALKEKHPLGPENLSLPNPPDGSVVPAVASEGDVRKGILSFHAGASGAPDGLRLVHLRSLVAHGSVEAGSRLSSALTDLVMLRDDAVFILYGANEGATRKKKMVGDVGSTIRRLSEKLGSRPTVQALGEELIGAGPFGISTRDCRHRRVLLKMWRVLEHLATTVFCGRLIPLQTDYSLTRKGLASETGIRQGDPIEPSLFALLVDEAARGVQSEFNVWYLDDSFLGDSPEKVHDDYFSGITGEAQSNWLRGEWKLMSVHHSQWQHAGGNGWRLKFLSHFGRLKLQKRFIPSRPNKAEKEDYKIFLNAQKTVSVRSNFDQRRRKFAHLAHLVIFGGKIWTNCLRDWNSLLFLGKKRCFYCTFVAAFGPEFWKICSNSKLAICLLFFSEMKGSKFFVAIK